MTALLSTEFMDRLKVASAAFMPIFGQELSGQGSGRMIVRELRSPLWSAQITTAELNHDDALDVQADLLNLAGSIDTFYCYDTRRTAPRDDPTGSILGGSTTVLIEEVVDNKHIRLNGLPSGYTLDRDYIAFDYSSPAVRALHQMIGSGVANGSGVTGSLAVRPNIRDGAAAGDRVYLIRPAAEMRIVPGSINVQTSGLFSVVSFTGIQVI